MTALEAYELTTKGGATDFARVIAACEAFGPYCLIGGLAVNCYVDPVYTLDAVFVVEHHPNSINLQAPGSDLRIQFTTDDRYQLFPARSKEAEVLEYIQKLPASKTWLTGNFGPIPTHNGA